LTLNQHDLDGIMSVFTPTENIVVLGTGPGERWQEKIRKEERWQTIPLLTLTIYVQPDPPDDAKQRANWLPSPKGDDFTLYIRAYWPKSPVIDGSWTPPPVQKRD